MARPLFQDIFLRLPPATAVLLLSAVFGLTDGHALPRQTKVVAYHELDVIPFPLPTGGPLSPFDLRRRQENTICGYIGGNPDMPATCSLGSHCVLDAAVSVVGCCPNGGACTTGVFTGCVDRNSDPQTEINPYVYTCQGTDVCFMNNFAGGYFQYGCGTASSLGTTVMTSADGATAALSIETVDVSLTESPSSLTAPTTIGSFASTETRSSQSDPTASSPTASPTSSLSSASTSPMTSTASVSTSSTPVTSSTSETSATSSTMTSHSTSKTHSSSSTSSIHIPSPTTVSPTPTATKDPAAAKQKQTGAIIGGVVGGAAAVISLVALVFFCLRRRNRNSRTGPGPEPTAPPTTQYISPIQSHGAAFAPLPSWHDDEGSPSPNFHNQSHPQPPEPYGPLESTQAASSSNYRAYPGPHPSDPYGSYEPSLSTPAPANLGATAHSYSQPLRYHPGYMPQPKGILTPVVEEDHQSLEREEPPGREIDDFSRAYSSAGIGQLTDEDTEGDRTPLQNNPYNTQYVDPGSHRSPGHRPLWQQNRQQSRNLMWL